MIKLEKLLIKMMQLIEGYIFFKINLNDKKYKNQLIFNKTDFKRSSWDDATAKAYYYGIEIAVKYYHNIILI